MVFFLPYLLEGVLLSLLGLFQTEISQLTMTFGVGVNGVKRLHANDVGDPQTFPLASSHLWF